jgi:UDP:flavonoid glycosyltransferase YjiC (YdhE family)
LLPHCAALVHHGGVGTVARALHAGIPQLILPLSWDQPDNAVRVKRLGVGDSLRPGRRTAAHLSATLSRLLTPEVHERCSIVRTLFGSTNGLNGAADLVEGLVNPLSF